MAKNSGKKSLILVNNSKYEGQYVAFDRSKGTKVQASGKSANSVLRVAREKGVIEPAIVFVPKKNVNYIY